MKVTHCFSKGLFFLALSIILLACNSKISDTSSKGEKNEIVVQLKGKVKPSAVVGAYQMYRVEMLKLLDKSTNTWLFTYDTTLISPEDMLNMMNNSQFATSARWPE